MVNTTVPATTNKITYCIAFVGAAKTEIKKLLCNYSDSMPNCDQNQKSIPNILQIILISAIAVFFLCGGIGIISAIISSTAESKKLSQSHSQSHIGIYYIDRIDIYNTAEGYESRDYWNIGEIRDGVKLTSKYIVVEIKATSELIVTFNEVSNTGTWSRNGDSLRMTIGDNDYQTDLRSSTNGNYIYENTIYMEHIIEHMEYTLHFKK